MATTYGLKYTSGTITRAGQAYTLNIYQRGYSGDSLEMGDIQGIGLQLQGASEAIDAPIIKTSLTFTLADSRDKGTVDGVKYGAWEEFYTPDATLYKVELKRGAYAMWTGFITPDSWQDGLVYRGSVSIVCRDNVGHMADFDFSPADIDAALGAGTVVAGMASVEEIVKAGLATAGVALGVYTDYDDYMAHIEADGDSINDWEVDLSAFGDKTWYEVVESVLAAAGMQLRYVDGNALAMLPLRHIHTMGYRPGDEQPEFDACFVGCSGTRTLEPAYKQIVETLQYDPCEGKAFRWGMVDESATASTWGADGFTQAGSGTYHIPALVPSSGGEWTNHDGTHEVLRPTKASLANWWNEAGGEEDRYVLLASIASTMTDQSKFDFVGLNTSNYAQTAYICAPNTPVSVSFDLAHTFDEEGDQYASLLPAGAYQYEILWQTPDSWMHLNENNEWETGRDSIVLNVPRHPDVEYYANQGYSGNDSVAVSHSFVTPGTAGSLVIRLHPFSNLFGGSAIGAVPEGAYHARLGNLNVVISSESFPRSLKVTTNYDLSQNLRCKRTVDLGPVPPRFGTAGAIRNGFYLPDLVSTSVFNAQWSDESAVVPLPVLNHLQMLSLHAKANNVLSGTLIDASQSPLRFDAEWHYANRKFILQGGTLNLLTGMMESATLREFDTYEEAIGEMSTDYSADFGEGNLRIQALQTGINAAASSGGGGGSSPSPSPGGGTVTSVGISVGTGLSVSGGPITTSGTINISVASNYTIPTTAKCNEWDAAYDAAHSHSNKSTLDNIGYQDVIHWSEAYSWGDHAEEGYVKDVVQSLGYTPANADTAIINDGTSFKVEKIVLVSEYPLPSHMDENVLYIRMPGLDD